MKVVVVGDGAREHAIVQKLSEDCRVVALMSRKNPGIARDSFEYYVCDTSNPEEVKAVLSGKEVELAFVSPDGLLKEGITDAIESLGIPCASPSLDSAMIECDKKFARQLMEDHRIPGLVPYAVVSSESEIVSAVKDIGECVVKPIGLTGGKGVKVMGEHLSTPEDAISYARELVSRNGEALIEKKLSGEEFTLQAFSDGKNLEFMPTVQDFKRAYEGNRGPNTGGMGSYSTGELLPFLDAKALDRAKSIMKKTVKALLKEGILFKGILYGQFMLSGGKPHIIEYNARFGDPEAINVLGVMDSSLCEMFISIAEGRLRKPSFSNECTVVKYVVPEGYPENPVSDALISVDEEEILNVGGQVFYASVYEKSGGIYTTTSRSVALLGIGRTLKEAESISEKSASFVDGPVFHRRDIGRF